MGILEANGINKYFGGIEANSNISFHIDEGETVGLIGPNGAGKTTLFNCIVGYHKPDAGTVHFEGQDITGWPPHRTNRAGIARTFQVIESKGDLTALEEVMVGAFAHTSRRHQAEKEARRLLDVLGIEAVSDQLIFELPVAMQKRVGFGRALATRPHLLMLDEVAAGLTASEISEFKRTLRDLKEAFHLTVFLIEHVMDMVMDLSERVIVLEGGMKICEGTPEKVANDEGVIKAYLGEKYVKSRKS